LTSFLPNILIHNVVILLLTELLAAYLAVLRFKDFLEGRTVILFTDHKPLVNALQSRLVAKHDRQQRHLSFILEYISSAQYIKGKDNVIADALSRDITPSCPSSSAFEDPIRDVATHFHTSDSSSTSSHFTPTVNMIITDALDLFGIARAQLIEHEIDSYKNKLKSFPLSPQTSILCDTSTMHPRPFVPSSLRKRIFTDLHSLSHPGPKASVRLIKSRYFWPGIDRDVREWSRQCHACQVSKVSRHTKTPILPLDIPSARFETVQIDLVGPLPHAHHPSTHVSTSFQYLLTCIDRNTRWLEAIPIPDTSAKAVAYSFLSNWISRFGVPLYILTDRGAQFESQLFSELSSLIGFHRLRTSSYRPSTNGNLERCHRILKASLKARGGDWFLSLPLVLLALRALPDEDGFSPFLRVTGKTPLFPHGLLPTTPSSVDS
jgi:hypothetical protein